MNFEKNKQIAKEWHEAFGTDALKYEYDKYLADDFTAEFFTGQLINKEQYIQMDQDLAISFTNSKVTVEEQIAEGNAVVSVMTWRAVHAAHIKGIAPTYKDFDIKGIVIDHFKDGKVIKHFPLFDQLLMMKQLGVVKNMVPEPMHV